MWYITVYIGSAHVIMQKLQAYSPKTNCDINESKYTHTVELVFGDQFKYRKSSLTSCV